MKSNTVQCSRTLWTDTFPLSCFLWKERGKVKEVFISNTLNRNDEIRSVAGHHVPLRLRCQSPGHKLSLANIQSNILHTRLFQLSFRHKIYSTPIGASVLVWRGPLLHIPACHYNVTALGGGETSFYTLEITFSGGRKICLTLIFNLLYYNISCADYWSW